MADEPIPKLEARLAEATDPIARVDALNALAWALRFTETARANGLATEARTLSIELGYALGQARAARTIGMTIVDLQGLGKILEFAHEAKDLFDQAGDDYGRAGSRDFLSTLHEFIGDLAGGMKWGLEALTIARAIGDPVRQGYALSSVGGILAASGEVDAAVEHLEGALALFEQVEDQQGVGTIRARLATVLRAAERFDEAESFAKLCRADAEARNDDFGLASSLRELAQIAQARGDDTTAEALYREALDNLTNPVAKDLIGAEVETSLGRLLIERGALDEAEAMLVDAHSRLQANSVTVVSVAEASQALAELYEKKGDPAAALQHLKRVLVLREEINQKEAKNKLAQVETRAEIEAAKKDAEIHELRYVELHGVQSKLVEAEKMALLGRLAAGTAHELNTPLGVLRSNNELTAVSIGRLLDLVDPGAATEAGVAKITSVLESARRTTDDALARIATITRRLGRFAELDQAQQRPFDVRECLDAALAILEPTLEGRIEVERRFEDVPSIEGWPRELNHAFMTVLQNAVQAIDDEGVVAVQTIATDSDEVRVRIRDTGRGMSEQQAAHLFDVAWSEGGTRTTMRLGLSAAYTTTQKHGGTIDVESTIGEGTTVTFCFPTRASG